MADNLPSTPLEPSGGEQCAATNSGEKQKQFPKRKRSTFPPSKRVEFAAALGLVVWVWSEMIETHGVSKLCVQWLILAIFYVPVCYFIYRWLNSPWIGKSLFVVLALVTAGLAYRNTFSPAFSIIPREQYVEMKTPRHFIKWNMNNRVILSPINVILLAQFTNLRDEGMTINSYQFEGRTTNGTWEIMPTIDIKMGSMITFLGTNWGKQGFGIYLGPAKEGDKAQTYFGDSVFPEVLFGKTIASGESVAGVIFLEGTKHGFDGNIRCRIRDSIDREFVESVSPLQGKQWLKTTVQFGINQPGGLPYSEEVTNLPVIPYSQEWQ
jgi:hypothetical protein